MGMFDDLIPTASLDARAPAGGGMFDDLIPSVDPREGAPPSYPPGGIGKPAPREPGILPDAITRPANDVAGIVTPLLDVSSDRPIGERVQDTINYAASVPFSALRLPTPGHMIENVTGLSGARESEERFVENNPAVINALGAVGEASAGLVGVPGTGFTRGPRVAPPKPRAPTPRDKMLADAKDIGVELPVAAAGGWSTRTTGAVVAQTPYVGSRLASASQKAYDQLSGAKDRVTQNLGGQGPVGAGEAVRDGILTWIKGGAEAINRAAYEAVDALIDPKLTVPLQETARAVKRLKAKDVASASTDGQKVINLVRDALARPEGLTYDGIKELRSRIGERLSGDITENGVSQKALKSLYGALSDDVRFAVGRAGRKRGGVKKAIAAFDRATATAKAVFEKREQLGKIIGADPKMTSGQAITERILTMTNSRKGGDIRRLVHAKSVLGQDAWNGVASAIVNLMGETKDGMSISQFRTAYVQKMSEAGRTALFGKKGTPHRDALDKIANVGQRAEWLQRAGNPSGTTKAALTVGAVFLFLQHPYAVVGAALGDAGIAEMLARPATARASANWMSRYSRYAANRTIENRRLVETAARVLAAKSSSDRAQQQAIEAKLRDALEPAAPTQ